MSQSDHRLRPKERPGPGQADAGIVSANWTQAREEGEEERVGEGGRERGVCVCALVKHARI